MSSLLIAEKADWASCGQGRRHGLGQRLEDALDRLVVLQAILDHRVEVDAELVVGLRKVALADAEVCAELPPLAVHAGGRGSADRTHEPAVGDDDRLDQRGVHPRERLGLERVVALAVGAHAPDALVHVAHVGADRRGLLGRAVDQKVDEVERADQAAPGILSVVRVLLDARPDGGVGHLHQKRPAGVAQQPDVARVALDRGPARGSHGTQGITCVPAVLSSSARSTRSGGGRRLASATGSCPGSRRARSRRARRGSA